MVAQSCRSDPADEDGSMLHTMQRLNFGSQSDSSASDAALSHSSMSPSGVVPAKLTHSLSCAIHLLAILLVPKRKISRLGMEILSRADSGEEGQSLQAGS
jgi:hypothetical protein